MEKPQRWLLLKPGPKAKKAKMDEAMGPKSSFCGYPMSMVSCIFFFASLLTQSHRCILNKTECVKASWLWDMPVRHVQG